MTRLVLALLVLSSALGWKIHDLARTNRANSELAHALGDELRQESALVSGFVQVMNQMLVDTPRVSGIEVRHGTEFTSDPARPTVVYVVQTQCGACAANVPALNRLHERGVQVVGVVPTEARRAVEVFGERTQAAFPVLFEPTGDLTDALPKNAVPLTGVVVGGQITELWIGALTEERVAVLSGLGL